MAAQIKNGLLSSSQLLAGYIQMVAETRSGQNSNLPRRSFLALIGATAIVSPDTPASAQKAPVTPNMADDIPKPDTPRFKRMLDAKLAISKAIDTDIPHGIAAVNSKLSEDEIVARSKGTASPELVRTYARELLPWTMQALGLVMTGTKDKADAEIADFVKASASLAAARTAMEKSGKPDFAWTGTVSGSTGNTNADAILSAFRRQAEPFKATGNSYLAFSDMSLSDKALERIEDEARADFLRSAGISPDKKFTHESRHDAFLKKQFKQYSDVGMRELSKLAAYDLDDGAINSPDLPGRMVPFYATLDKTVTGTRTHARAKYLSHMLQNDHIVSKPAMVHKAAPTL